MPARPCVASPPCISAKSLKMSHSHSHDGGHSHSHDGALAVDHGHTHEILEHPGKFAMRDMPSFDDRNWRERSFTVGIGGPVGSGGREMGTDLIAGF